MTMHKQKENSAKDKNKTKLFNRVLLALIVVAGAGYLAGVNDLAINSYVLQQHKKQFNEVKNQNNELEVKVMSLSSYNNLSQKIGGLKMVKVDSVDYLNPVTAVAKK